MELQPKTVVVNGREYMISKFMADVGIKVFLRLMKIAGEPFAKAVGGYGESEAEFQRMLPDVIMSLADRLDEKTVLSIIEDLLSVVIPAGQTYPLGDADNPSRSNWRLYFKGRLADLFTVLVMSTKENFEDFTFALRLAQSKLGAKVKAKDQE